MRPAFASTREAAAFAFLLLIALLLPALLSKSLLPLRQELYAFKGWDTTGPHPYHYQLIFEEKGDIDIAFVGSSQIMHGIDTPYVQEALSKKLGHPATVRTLGWGGAGYDALYFITKDLLEHRQVKMIVFYDECQFFNKPNPLAPVWFRFGDDNASLAGLPLDRRLNYYFAAIIGMPKNLLSLVRSHRPADMSPKKMEAIDRITASDDPIKSLGSIGSHHGYNASMLYDDYAPFVPYSPPHPLDPSDVRLNFGSPSDDFQFNGPPVPSWQLHFARKFAALAQEHGVKLVMLHMPVIKEKENETAFVNERENWPKVLQADITMVGVPPAVFFKGMSDDNARQIFDDIVHLNKNGQDYFTHALTPRLLEIYATQVTP